MKKILLILGILLVCAFAYAEDYVSPYSTGNDIIVLDDYSKIEKYSYINENKLTTTKDFTKIGKTSLKWEWTIDKYRNQVVGFVKNKINRPVPETIEFYIYPNNKVLLYVGIADKYGNRQVQFPVLGIEEKTWNKVSLKVADLPTFARGAEKIKDLDSIFIGTQDGAGEYAKSGKFSAYISEIRLIYPYGTVIPQKHNANETDLLRETVKNKLALIEGLLSELNGKGLSCRYELAAKTVIEKFIQNSKEEQEERKIDRAYSQLEYIDKLSDKTLKDLNEIKLDPNKHINYVEANMSNLTLKDGVYYDGDRPVFMMGVMGWIEPSDFVKIKNNGFNFTAFEFAMSELDKEEYLDNHKQIMDSLVANNIAFAPLMSPHYVKGEVYDANPTMDPNSARRIRNQFMPWDVTSKEFHNYVFKNLDIIIPLTKNYKNLVGYDLINELWYDMLPDFDYDKFQKDNIKYDNPWTAQSEYTKYTVYEFLKAYQEYLLSLDNTKPVFTKTIGNMEVIGADREVLSEILTGQGVDQYTNSIDPTDEFALDLWNQAITLDTFRSFQPNKMVYDGEYHINPYSGAICSEKYTNLVLWNSFVRGKDMSGIWVWGRGIENEANCFYCQPWEVYAAGKATMDVNRVAEYVVPFAKQKGEYAIYYGGSDFENLYKAANFSDVNFDLITNNMIEKGKTYYKFVLYMDNANISDKALKILKDKNVKVIKVKSGCGDKKMWNIINSNIKKEKIMPYVDINKWGVEVRSYYMNDKIYYYLMNYNKKPVDITLPKTSKDLLSGKTYDKIKLESMDVYLLEM